MTKRQKEFLDHLRKVLGGEKIEGDFETNFTDSAGAPNMQEIVDMTVALPEAIKAMPIDELKKLAPKLQAIIANAGSGAGEETAVEDEDGEGAEGEGDKPADAEGEAVDVADEDGEAIDVKDSAEFKDALAKAVDGRVKEHTEVIIKARDFVDEKYVFADKSTNQIMRDALAVEHGTQKFADEELPVAFKLLKKTTSKYENFADEGNKTKFEDLKKKEL